LLLTPRIVAADRAAGRSAYIGEGINRWPAVHRFDAGRLVRLGVEGAPAGSVLHAVGEQGVAIRDVAEAIGRGLDLPVTSITAEQAQAHFGFLAGFLALDMPASNAFTRELLSWEPSGPGLVADLEQGHYFAARQPERPHGTTARRPRVRAPWLTRQPAVFLIGVAC